MYLIAPFIAWALAQIIKTVIDLITGKELSLARALGSGGMPSSHSSTVCRLTAMIAQTQGIGSPLTAMSFIFSLIVMYDAMNVRRETGDQGKMINELIELLTDMGRDIPVEKKFKELVGHTPLQVFFGALLGVAVGAGYYRIFVQ